MGVIFGKVPEWIEVCTEIEDGYGDGYAYGFHRSDGSGWGSENGHSSGSGGGDQFGYSFGDGIWPWVRGADDQ